MKIHLRTFRLPGALLIAAVLTLPATLAFGRGGTLVDEFVSAMTSRLTHQVPGMGTVEVAFSPAGGAEELVVKVIDSARSEIRMLAYSFTSVAVTRALVRARKRGVDVRLVADYRHNVAEDRSGKARAALSALANVGADVRVTRAFAIHHDKVICVDGQTVELGSFNFSEAAARKNSENVFVNWNNPPLAKLYLQHFERNYRQSEAFQTQY